MRFISPLIADARGSLGGTTFGRNPSGVYARARTSPAQPRTASQVANRASFTTAAQAWKALDPTVIIAWNAYAETRVRRDSLGQKFTPCGFNVFMQCMRNLQMIGSTAVPAVPFGRVPFPAGFYYGIAFTCPAGVITSAVAVISTDWSAFIGNIVVQVTAPHSPGQVFAGRALFRNIAVGDLWSGADLDLTPGFTALYPTAVIGQMIVSRLRYIDPTTGLAAMPQTGEFGLIQP